MKCIQLKNWADDGTSRNGQSRAIHWSIYATDDAYREVKTRVTHLEDRLFFILDFIMHLFRWADSHSFCKREKIMRREQVGMLFRVSAKVVARSGCSCLWRESNRTEAVKPDGMLNAVEVSSKLHWSGNHAEQTYKDAFGGQRSNDLQNVMCLCRWEVNLKFGHSFADGGLRLSLHLKEVST